MYSPRQQEFMHKLQAAETGQQRPPRALLESFATRKPAGMLRRAGYHRVPAVHVILQDVEVAPAKTSAYDALPTKFTGAPLRMPFHARNGLGCRDSRSGRIERAPLPSMLRGDDRPESWRRRCAPELTVKLDGKLYGRSPGPTCLASVTMSF